MLHERLDLNVCQSQLRFGLWMEYRSITTVNIRYLSFMVKFLDSFMYIHVLVFSLL